MSIDSQTEVETSHQVHDGRFSYFLRPLAPYYLIIGATTLLLVLGLVMVLSASSVTSYAANGSSFAVALKQLMWVAIGLPIMVGLSRAPVKFYRRTALFLVVLAFILLMLVFVPGLGKSVNGNRNWIDFGGPIRIQPSEFAKFALIVWGAHLLALKETRGEDWIYVIKRLGLVAVGFLLLVLAGGDLGTSLVLMAITGALLFFAGIPMRVLAIVIGLGLGAASILSLSHGYRRQRFQSWLDPSSDPLGAGWQALHSTYALASGGWWGVGLGASREKWGDLPDAHTDFIFAIIGEELGLFGTLVVLALLAAICVSGLVIAIRTKNTFVRLAAAGAVTWILIQAVVNVGAVLGLLPITGIPLPLVSYGGSALIPTMAAIGMLMAFSRREPDAVVALQMRGPNPWRRFFSDARSGSNSNAALHAVPESGS